MCTLSRFILPKCTHWSLLGIEILCSKGSWMWTIYLEQRKKIDVCKGRAVSQDQKNLHAEMIWMLLVIVRKGNRMFK